MKQIEFFAPKDIIDSLPHPVPANKCIPEWFKRMNRDIDNNPSGVGTVKNCVPLRDCLTSGYIIPLWEDMQITSSSDNNGEINYKWSRNLSGFYDGAISTHSTAQVEGMPISNTDLGHLPIKFNSPWVIRTPPGYSCLFTMPFNRYDQNFEILSGIVDTDTYFDSVAFPFVFLKSDVSEILHKGMPLVQVTPFKRTEWKSSIKDISPKEEKIRNRVLNLIGSTFRHGYLNNFWSKKKYN